MMIVTPRQQWRPDDRPNPARPLADAVQRLRLVELAHSCDPLAAAVATAALLLLPRIDQLIDQPEQMAWPSRHVASRES